MDEDEATSEAHLDGEGSELQIGPIPIGAMPGLARIAAGAWVRGAVWGIGTGLRASRRLTEAALSGESAADLFDDVRDETVENLRRLLGIVERDSRGEPITGVVATRLPQERDDRDQRRQRVASLRERGAQLFDRASEVGANDDPVHPGFERIVDQLAPDEARILKLLVNEGPQAIVYINKAGPLGIGAREVARRLSLVGREAGCLHPDLVPAYLDNLVRLGLVAIRRDPIEDEAAYQVLEAQPEVIDAIRSVRGGIFRGQSSRRSIHITDFGRSFCQVCFPAEHLTGEFEALDPEAAVEVPDVVAAERDVDGGRRDGRGSRRRR